MQKTKLVYNYLNYLLRSGTSYGVHSPFVFEFIKDVLKENSLQPDYLKVENLKKALLKESGLIRVTDYGAGSTVLKDPEKTISQITRNSSKPKKIGRLFYKLSAKYKPQNILELGTAMGLSSAYLALGNVASQVSTIEGCPNIAAKAKQNFESLNLSNIHLINGQFDEVLADTLKKIKTVDLAFIDGNHRREPTLRYFEQCLKHSVNDTILVFDDINWSEEMIDAWDTIKKHSSVRVTIDIFFMGFVFLRKELSKEHFVIRF